MQHRTLFIILVFFITWNVLGQKVLEPEEIVKLIPKEINRYYEDGDTKSSLIKLGDIRYSLCERRFSRGNQKIKILLFDYKEAPIMYRQAMRKWNTEPVVSDSLILRTVAMENCLGWESYNRHSNTSQVFLGVCDRFFLMLSAENIELDELKEVVGLFSFASFPK